jgi:guanylate kinase
MGKSSTGKDTIYKELLAKEQLNLRRIVPYTTRPIREGEKNGEEYFFTDEEGIRRLEAENRIIEMRCYDTCFGPWKYLTVNDEQIDLSQNDYLLIGTPEAYLSMRTFFGKEVVVPLLIEIDDGIRLQRALDREKQQQEPKYDEMCRRFLADAKDFSEETLAECEIAVRFVNENLTECIDSLVEYIGKMQS